MREGTLNAYVFTGPTLSVAEGRAVLDAHFLPPAAQGDVYAAARHRPTAIGIVDGYFDRVPSVWHKEILWALSQGVHVFGSASMGALRAVELARFGMVGVGKIFEDFAAGRLEDDDEVTIVHAAAQSGFRAGSEAMVNVRATLAAAWEAGVIGAELRDRLVARVKAWHYSERNWSRVLGEASADDGPPGELAALQAWLATGRVDRKRDDALAMLRAMRERIASDPGPKQVSFPFHHTQVWEMLRCRVDEGAAPAIDVAGGRGADALLDELRLEGEGYRVEREQALVRLLALEVAQRRGLDVDDATSRNELGRGAASDAEDRGSRSRIAREGSLVRRIRAIARPRLDPHFLQHLEAQGEATRLRQRAEVKQAALTLVGLDNPSLDDVDIGERELWHWYFRGCLDREPPPDLEAWAESLDFESVHALRRAVLREYCYRRIHEAGREQGARDGRSIGSGRSTRP